METPDNRTNPQKAVDEIMEILKKYDLAAVALISDKDCAAWIRRIDPTWSCAWMEEEGDGSQKVRVRARLNEDYDGDKERQRAAVAATVGLFLSSANWCESTEAEMKKVMDLLSKQVTLIGHRERWTGGKW